MTTFVPFAPLVVTSLTGKSSSIAAQATSGGLTIASTVYAPNLLVVAQGPTGVAVFVRMVNSTVIPTATNGDVPVMCGYAPVLFANPSPLGTAGIAVICSLTTTPVTVYFTPGQGGA